MKTLKTIAFVAILINHATAQNFSIDSLIKNEIDLSIDSIKEELAALNLTDAELLKHTASAHYIYMESGNIKSAVKDMENNLSFNEWLAKHPNVKLEENLLIVKSDYSLMKNKKSTNYTSLPAKNRLPHSIISKNDLTTSSGKWIFNYSPKNKFSDEFLIGFYFTSDFGFEVLTENAPKIIAYGNAIEEKGNVMLSNFNQEPALNKILSFLEKLIDICAAIVINYNNPDIIRYTIANVLVPKMVKSTSGFQK